MEKDKSSCQEAISGTEIIPIMTTVELKNIAVEDEGYETPSLNERLYLNYKGYRKIENLDEYTGLKALWLDANGIRKIENISHLRDLRCLFLQQNLITSIKNGLRGLENLVQLDLSENRLDCIDGLSSLPNLSTLNLSKNYLKSGRDICHLTDCKGLCNINMSHNQLHGHDVVDVLSKMCHVVAISMAGNPITKELPHFRKKCIVAIRGLRYLDKPVFDMERATAESWAIGGREAELETRKCWQKKKLEEDKRCFKDFHEWSELLARRKLQEVQKVPEEEFSKKEQEDEKRREERMAEEAADVEKESSSQTHSKEKKGTKESFSEDNRNDDDVELPSTKCGDPPGRDNINS